MSQAIDQLQPEERGEQRYEGDYTFVSFEMKTYLEFTTECHWAVSVCGYVYKCVSVHVASSETECEDHCSLILPDVIHLFVSNGQCNDTLFDTSRYLLFNL